LNGSKAREAILIRRKDEPQRNDRKASDAYPAMELSTIGGPNWAGSAYCARRAVSESALA
jgi:hypothetical protein